MSRRALASPASCAAAIASSAFATLSAARAPEDDVARRTTPNPPLPRSRSTRYPGTVGNTRSGVVFAGVMPPAGDSAYLQGPQSSEQLSKLVPVPHDSVAWQTPSPQVKFTSGRMRVESARYDFPWTLQEA